MSQRSFLAADRSWALDIEDPALDTMLEHCRQSGGLETGGVLLGHYSVWGDRAIVTAASGPPADSIRLPSSFVRGVVGLGDLFRGAWRTRQYYLGDWHFHPNASARPSGQDVAQMRAFAADVGYRCPTPLLVVVGGSPDQADIALTVTAVTADGAPHAAVPRQGAAVTPLPR